MQIDYQMFTLLRVRALIAARYGQIGRKLPEGRNFPMSEYAFSSTDGIG
jgi:hypothetical protein